MKFHILKFKYRKGKGESATTFAKKEEIFSFLRTERRRKMNRKKKKNEQKEEKNEHAHSMYDLCSSAMKLSCHEAETCQALLLSPKTSK